MDAKDPGPQDPDEPQDPEDPRYSPGLEPGGQVPPGETPPGEDSTGGAGPDESHNPAKGWARTPVIIIGVVVLLFLIYFVAWAVEL